MSFLKEKQLLTYSKISTGLRTKLCFDYQQLHYHKKFFYWFSLKSNTDTDLGWNIFFSLFFLFFFFSFLLCSELHKFFRSHNQISIRMIMKDLLLLVWNWISVLPFISPLLLVFLPRININILFFRMFRIAFVDSRNYYIFSEFINQRPFFDSSKVISTIFLREFFCKQKKFYMRLTYCQ